MENSYNPLNIPSTLESVDFEQESAGKESEPKVVLFFVISFLDFY
jgi:hypothetical protein